VMRFFKWAPWCCIICNVMNGALPNPPA
jgi:hypothetical protein